MFRAAHDYNDNGIYDPQWDFDDDGDIDDITNVVKVDTDILFFITEIVGTLFGDATLDGRVTSADLNVVGTSWSLEDLIEFWGVGDMNGDGDVDAQDLNMVAVNWQMHNGNWGP